MDSVELVSDTVPIVFVPAGRLPVMTVEVDTTFAAPPVCTSLTGCNGGPRNVSAAAMEASATENMANRILGRMDD